MMLQATGSMESAKIAVAILAVVVSVLSLAISQLASRRARRAEDVKALLGEKESVGFAGLKLLRDGLPRDGHQRNLVIRALVQACLFEGSDRARALLYRVIEENRKEHGDEFREALGGIEETFDRMQKYNFTVEELDLSRGMRRLRALQAVINTPLQANSAHDPQKKAEPLPDNRLQGRQVRP